jgi:hypothetical protein
MLKILGPKELTDELMYDFSPIRIVSTAANPGRPVAVMEASPEKIVSGEVLFILVIL